MNSPSMTALVTVRKRSLGQGNVFTPVCDSVREGGSLSQHAPMHHRSHDGGGGLCRGGVCPRGSLSGGFLLGRPDNRDPRYGNKWVVHILLECILVLHLCVILFTGGGGIGSQHASRGSASRGSAYRGQLGRPPPNTTGYGQQVGGTHPTGMHSRLNFSKPSYT